MQTNWTEFLEEYDKKTQALDHHVSSERALWHLLEAFEDQLPEIDGYFHKCFRQCDVVVVDDKVAGHIDVAIWVLLYNAPIFWKLFGKYAEEGKGG